MCMSVNGCHICMVSKEAKRRYWVFMELELWVIVSYLIGLLGTELKSCRKATSVLDGCGRSIS